MLNYYWCDKIALVVIGKLKLTVRVQKRILPHPGQWAFHLDLW